MQLGPAFPLACSRVASGLIAPPHVVATSTRTEGTRTKEQGLNLAGCSWSDGCYEQRLVSAGSLSQVCSDTLPVPRDPLCHLPLVPCTEEDHIPPPLHTHTWEDAGYWGKLTLEDEA